MHLFIHSVGVTFTAKTVLDVNIYPESNPLPLSMQSPSLFETQASGLLDDYRNIPLKRGVFPRPYADTNLPHRCVMMIIIMVMLVVVMMMMMIGI